MNETKGGIIEIIIRDENYRKIENFKCNISDKKLCKKFITYVQHKYDIIEPFEDKKESEWIEEDDFF